MKIRVGVVGTGFGTRVQVPGFRRSGEFDVTAVWSRTEANARRAAETFGIPRVCTSWEELAALAEVDAVSVATPPAFHYPASGTGRRAPTRSARASASAGKRKG